MDLKFNDLVAYMGFQAFLKVDAVFVSFRLKFPQFSPFQATWFQIKLFGGKCK